MTHTAKMVALTKVADVTEELMPFIQFKAERDGRELTGNEEVIILQIEGTQSYHPIFLPAKLEKIEEELKELDVTLNADAKNKISNVV